MAESLIFFFMIIIIFLRFKSLPAQSEDENMDFYFDDIPSTSQSMASFNEYSPRVSLVHFNSIKYKKKKKT